MPPLSRPAVVRLTAFPLVGVRVTPVALRVLVLPAVSLVVVPAALVTLVLPAPSVAVTLVNTGLSASCSSMAPLVGLVTVLRFAPL